MIVSYRFYDSDYYKYLKGVNKRKYISIGIILTIVSLMTIHESKGQTYLEDSLKNIISSKVSVPKEKVSAAIQLSTIYYCGEESKKYAQLAMRIVPEDDEILTAYTFIRWAWIKSCYEEVDSADFYLSKAINLFDKNQDSVGLAMTYMRQATLFNEYKYDFEVINQIFSKAFDYVKSSGNVMIKATVLNNWSIHLYKNNRYEDAEKKLLYALDITESINDIPHQGRLRFNLAMVYQLSNQPLKAMEYYLSSYEFRRQDKNLGAKAETLMRLAELLIELKSQSVDTTAYQQIYVTTNLPDEFTMLDSVLSYALLQQSNSLLNKAYKVKVKAHVQSGDYKNAYLTLEELKKISEEELLSKKNLETLVSIETRYEKQILENDLLKNKIEQQQSKTQRSYLIIAIILLSLITVSGYLFFQRNLLQRQLEIDFQKQQVKDLENQQQLLAVNAMLDGQEQERARIAKDLHDGLGSLLTSVKHNIVKINAVSPLQSNVEHLIDEACTEVRRIAHNMMPEALKHLGLHHAVKDLASKINQVQPFKVIFQSYGEVLRMDENKEIMIFRAVQEVFNNIQKHAEANEVIIQITYGEDWFNLTIEDDGIGFDKTSKDSKLGLGLRSIVSRIEYISGECLIESEKGQGTSISISLSNVHKVIEASGHVASRF